MGVGLAESLLPECAGFGQSGLLVHGRSLRASGILDRILARKPERLTVFPWEHGGGEPNLAQLADLLACARKRKSEWIAGVGGGSVMDLAKACAGLFNTKGEVETYHNGAPVEASGIPFAAVPTTAGTGTEATVNSVLTNTNNSKKKSIRDKTFIASLVILDPGLLRDCPPQVIAHAGMDAFTQALEAYSSCYSTWFSDVFSLKALELISANLILAFSGARHDVTRDLLVGSYFAGLAFSTARLGVVHGLAHPLGVRYHLPHGLVCAICLPCAIELNREAMGVKYPNVSKTIGHDLLQRTNYMLNQLGIVSPLKGKRILDKDEIIKETVGAWSTAANPKKITAEDVEFLLNRIFGAD